MKNASNNVLPDLSFYDSYSEHCLTRGYNTIFLYISRYNVYSYVGTADSRQSVSLNYASMAVIFILMLTQYFLYHSF